jgi:ABC-type transport system substrate-binding protein
MKKALTVLLAAGSLALAGCSSRSTTYRLALRHLPTEGDPFTSQVNTDHLVMLQLYYPLFTRLSSGALTSEFLDLNTTRASNAAFTRFDLCLRPGLNYSDGSPVEIADLAKSLTESHKRQESLPDLIRVTPHDHCVSVELKTRDLRYFDQLTDVSNTVVSATRKIGVFPMGLGPYRVAEVNSTHLRLVANEGRVRGDFKAIEFVKYTNMEQDLRDGVIDFNHTGQIEIPARIRAQFQRVSRPAFKSYALVLNYPDSRLRQAFARCFDTANFVKLLEIPLTPVPGFLPLGIMGSEIGTVEGELRSPTRAIEGAKPEASVRMPNPCRLQSAPPLTVYNYLDEAAPKIVDFFRTHQAHFPVPVEVKTVSVDELVKAMFSRDRIGAVIGFDSSSSLSSTSREASAFFENFMRHNRSERLITQPIQGLEESVRLALDEAQPELKDVLYRDAHRILLDSGYVIPLGQLETDQYYPKYITNISWSDPISGYPRIDLMQIE